VKKEAKRSSGRKRKPKIEKSKGREAKGLVDDEGKKEAEDRVRQKKVVGPAG